MADWEKQYAVMPEILNDRGLDIEVLKKRLKEYQNSRHLRKKNKSLKPTIAVRL